MQLTVHSILILLDFLAVSVLAQSWDAGSGTELSCSVIIWGSQDYYWTGPEIPPTPLANDTIENGTGANLTAPSGPTVDSRGKKRKPVDRLPAAGRDLGRYFGAWRTNMLDVLPRSIAYVVGLHGDQATEADITDLQLPVKPPPQKPPPQKPAPKKRPAQRPAAQRFTSHCLHSIPLARQRCGGKGLNFVPTMFWRDYEDDVTRAPKGYCYKTNFGDDQIGNQCTDLKNDTAANRANSSRLINEYYLGMKACFTAAINAGFTKLKVTPHLDDGAGRGGWRNLLGVDPWAKKQGYSYVDIMIRPLVRALKESIAETPAGGKVEVKFTMQGEMNWCLVVFPKEFSRLASSIKQWLMSSKVDGSTAVVANSSLSRAGVGPRGSAANAASQQQQQQQVASKVSVGVSLNYNKLCGEGECYDWTTINKEGDRLDKESFIALLQQMDYLGISHYPSLYNGYRNGYWSWEGPIQALDNELRGGFGFSLSQFYDQPGKEFHLSEFGIGGGESNCGCQPATSVQLMADRTFFGMFGIYGHFKDPWQQQWAKDFQKEFYHNALRWLSGKGGPSYRVDGAYLWCMSSWDVSGIYWTSLNHDTNGTYYDPDIMASIRNYNDKRWLP